MKKMTISFRSISYETTSNDCELLAKWHNDPELRELWLPRRSETHQRPYETASGLRKQHGEPTDFHPLSESMILLEGTPVGQFVLYLNPPHRLSKGALVAWPTLVIGDAHHRRKGIGTAVGKHILQLARAAHATHIEAGVFEFNHPIRNFLEKVGFLEIGRVPDFTWYDGRKRPDIRYELRLR